MKQAISSYTGSEPYVFVSYSHTDEKDVLAEILWLQELGVNVWFDEGIHAGVDWSESLAAAITGSFNFLFFVTPNSISSENCRRELIFANQQGISVTAIHLVPTEMTGGMLLSLGNRQAIFKFKFSPSEYKAKVSSALHAYDENEIVDRVLANEIVLKEEILDSRMGVVVLPFSNFSNDDNTRFLAEGITDEINSDLSSLGSLRVISRSSASQIEIENVNYKFIREKLGVTYILEGRIQFSRDRVRVTVQLNNANTQEVRWAGKWNSLLEDVFDIQEEISLGVVSALRLELNESQSNKITERRIPNTLAYEYYCRARQLIHTYDVSALKEALDYLRRGEEIVGESIYILSAMGFVYWQFVNIRVESTSKYKEKAQKCIKRLFEIDPDSPDAHRISGLMDIWEKGKIQSSVNHLKISLESNPNDVDALFWRSTILGFAGRTAAAFVHAEHLIKLDPLTTFHHVLPGLICMMQGDFASANSKLAHSYEINPGNPITTLLYGQALAMSGQSSEAKNVLRSLEKYGRNDYEEKLAAFLAFCIDKNKAGALALVDEELKSNAKLELQSSWTMAQGYALLGIHRESIFWTENAINCGFLNYPFISEQDPLLAPIRSEEGFVALMVRLKEKWIYFNA